MSFTGHIHNGEVVLDEPAALPDGTAVRVEPVLSETPSAAPDPPLSFLERYKSVIGLIDDPDLPTDGALNHDHYLYGLPKKS